MPLPTVSLEFTDAIFNYLAERGVTEARVLAHIGLVERRQLCIEQRVPLARYEALFEAGEALCDDRYFGLNMGQALFPRNWGLVSHLALSAPDALAALTSLMKYVGLHLDFIQFEFTELGKDELELTWRCRTRKPINPHVIEHMFANAIRFANSHAGYAMPPLHFEFAHLDRGNAHHVSTALASSVKFARPRDRVIIPRRWLDRQSLHSQEELFLHTESLAQQRLKELRGGDKYIDATRERILEQLLEGKASVAETARAMNTTTRTLQRRLFEKQLSYQALLDEVRQELAQQLMVDTTISLTEVALYLGFNDQSAFHHAYKRWRGTTLAEYRKRH